MSLTSIFDVAGSAMSAQSIRLNTTASNLANANSASSSVGTVYRARHPVFAAIQNQVNSTAFPSMSDQATAGVQVLEIVESAADLKPRYEPDHPMADEEGFVYYPNVNVVEEMTDMISASRSFQMNVEVMNSAKSMMQRVLAIGQ